MRRPSGHGRVRVLTFVMTMVCANALISWLPAQAGVPGAGPRQVVGHDMGSQIRKHEGGDPRADPRVSPATSVLGMDVSSHQEVVDWKYWWGQGMRFAYVKATEGTGYINPYFPQQYNGSYNVGMIRGAYHFALPNISSGAAQARYFVRNGGGWSPDGKTLPGAVDMEYNPYGPTCYGKTPGQMTAWIKDFSDTYHDLTGRYPTIYTSKSWWTQCVGGAFSSTNPLWVARYSDQVGALPYDWSYHTFWQYTSSPLDHNLFNGSYRQLKAIALGKPLSEMPS